MKSLSSPKIRFLGIVSRKNMKLFSRLNECPDANCSFFQLCFGKRVQPGQRGCAIGLHGCFRLFSLEKYKSAAELEKLGDKGNHVIDYLSRKFAQVMMFCGVNHQNSSWKMS